MKNVGSSICLLIFGSIVAGGLIWLLIAVWWTIITILESFGLPMVVIISVIIGSEIGGFWRDWRMRRIEKALGISPKEKEIESDDFSEMLESIKNCLEEDKKNDDIG